MAVLYKRKSDQKLVIIKEINLKEMTKDQRNLAINEGMFIEFIRSRVSLQSYDLANVLKILEHPNIIRYMSNFEIDSHLHIMMEYADRGSLHDFIQSQTQNVKSSRVIDILRQLVSGLKYMHEKRILHRDLKTQNIFMTSRPQLVKIGDLGIAKVMTTHNQTVVGTCSYISPELCEARNYNEKSDIWSLGCCLYELMTRKKAFDGPNPLTIVKKIVAGKLAIDNISSTLYSSVNYKSLPKSSHDPGLRKLISDILQKDPTKRPSANELDEQIIPKLQNSIHQNISEEISQTENIIEVQQKEKIVIQSNLFFHSGDGKSNMGKWAK